MSHTGTPQSPLRRRRLRPSLRYVGLLVGVLLVAGVLVFAVSRLNLHRIGHALVNASPGWIALALLLMALSMVLRSVSWQQILRAALPHTPIPWKTVLRATMIGVMASAVFPGRVGEPTRVVVVARRLQGPTKRLLAVIAATVFSQTANNLIALVVLAAVPFSSVSFFPFHLRVRAGTPAVP